MTALDLQILDFLQQYCRNSVLDQILCAVSRLGDFGMVWIALTAVLLLVPKTRRTGVIVAMALILDLLLCNCLLKPLVARTRPYVINSAVEILIPKPVDYSFPSGHSAASFAVVTALYCVHSRLRYPAFVLSLMMAFSRMYLYVHYPSDVLGGALIGMICGCAATKLFGILLRRWNKKRRPNDCPSDCKHACDSCTGKKRSS